MSYFLVVLDEFGQTNLSNPSSKDPPFFGLAGIAIPGNAIGVVTKAVVTLKSEILRAPSHLVLEKEIKGARLFIPNLSDAGIRNKLNHKLSSAKTAGQSYKPTIIDKLPVSTRRDVALRLMKLLKENHCAITYYGVTAKTSFLHDGRAYKRMAFVSANALAVCNVHFTSLKQTFSILLDEHVEKERHEIARKQLVKSYDKNRALIDLPVEFNSKTSQLIQLADWIATLVGHVEAYAKAPQQFSARQTYDDLVGPDIRQLRLPTAGIDVPIPHVY